jgi:hypothetical protein
MSMLAVDTSKPYRIDIVICVDRPELRDASFMPVPPGTRTVCRYWHATQGAAVREFSSIVRGDWDFASEYAAAVSVVKMQPSRSPRTVRRRVECTREQLEDVTTRRRRSLQVAAARRGALLVWRFPPLRAAAS